MLITNATAISIGIHAAKFMNETQAAVQLNSMPQEYRNYYEVGMLAAKTFKAIGGDINAHEVQFNVTQLYEAILDFQKHGGNIYDQAAITGVANSLGLVYKATDPNPTLDLRSNQLESLTVCLTPYSSQIGSFVVLVGASSGSRMILNTYTSLNLIPNLPNLVQNGEPPLNLSGEVRDIRYLQDYSNFKNIGLLSQLLLGHAAPSEDFFKSMLPVAGDLNALINQFLGSPDVGHIWALNRHSLAVLLVQNALGSDDVGIVGWVEDYLGSHTLAELAAVAITNESVVAHAYSDPGNAMVLFKMR